MRWAGTSARLHICHKVPYRRAGLLQGNYLYRVSMKTYYSLMVVALFATSLLLSCSVIPGKTAGSQDGETTDTNTSIVSLEPSGSKVPNHIAVIDKPADAAGEALVAGVIKYDDCVYIEFSNGTKALVVWPFGTHWDRQKQNLVVPRLGNVRESQRIEANATYIEYGDWLGRSLVPASCRQAQVVYVDGGH